MTGGRKALQPLRPMAMPVERTRRRHPHEQHGPTVLSCEREKRHATGPCDRVVVAMLGRIVMHLRPGFCAVLITACTFANNSHAQVLMQRDVSLAMALTIATTASSECGAITSIAVVDRAGR